MSPNEPDNRDDEELLREYLEGDSQLSRLYRRHADELPDPGLDARIRARARDALSRKAARSPFAGHWVVPVSLAAVVVLSVSVVLLLPHPGSPPTIAPEPAAPSARQPPAETPRARPRGTLEEEAGRQAGADSLKRAESAERRAQPQAARKGVQKAAPAPAGGSGAAVAPAAPSGMAAGSGTGAASWPSEAVRGDPQAWLRHIENLLGAGDEQDARANLRAFRARYPDHPLPPSLERLARALDAERP